MVATLVAFLPISHGCASHDLRGHETQADSHDGLRGGQQREGLRVEDAGPNDLVNVIAEGMDLLRRESSPLESDRLRARQLPPRARRQRGVLLIPLSRPRRRVSLHQAWRQGCRSMRRRC